jgi:hypothetical protein
VILLSAVHQARAQSETVFTTNYDIQLTADRSFMRANSRAKVRDGHTIPVPLGNFRVDLRVSAVGNQKFKIELELYERTDDSRFAKPDSTYHLVNPVPLKFDGAYGIPVEFKTTIAEIDLDIAIAISEQTQ